MRTIETTVYQFSELSESAQQSAHERYGYDDVDLSMTVGEFTELLEKIGFSNIKVYWSGFYSQGDGLSFTGQYTYKKGFLKAVKSEWRNAELHVILDRLQELQSLNFYRLESDIHQCGHYLHENTMYDYVDVHLIKIWRSLAQWMYRQLEKEYEYLTSFEAFRDMSGLWEFTEEGFMV